MNITTTYDEAIVKAMIAEAAARDATRAAQEAELRRVLAEVEAAHGIKEKNT